MPERSRALSARAAALLLALAAGLLLLLPAPTSEAQTTVTLVSNTGQTSGSQELHFNNRAYAQAFTTGAATTATR